LLRYWNAARRTGAISSIAVIIVVVIVVVVAITVGTGTVPEIVPCRIYWLQISRSSVVPQMFLNRIRHVAGCHDIPVERSLALGTEQLSHVLYADKVCIVYAFALAMGAPLGRVKLVDSDDKIIQGPCLDEMTWRQVLQMDSQTYNHMVSGGQWTLKVRSRSNMRQQAPYTAVWYQESW
jgi:hypothetical protein